MPVLTSFDKQATLAEIFSAPKSKELKFHTTPTESTAKKTKSFWKKFVDYLCTPSVPNNCPEANAMLEIMEPRQSHSDFVLPTHSTNRQDVSPQALVPVNNEILISSIPGPAPSVRDIPLPISASVAAEISLPSEPIILPANPEATPKLTLQLRRVDILALFHNVKKDSERYKKLDNIVNKSRMNKGCYDLELTLSEIQMFREICSTKASAPFPTILQKINLLGV